MAGLNNKLGTPTQLTLWMWLSHHINLKIIPCSSAGHQHMVRLSSVSHTVRRAQVRGTTRTHNVPNVQVFHFTKLPVADLANSFYSVHFMFQFLPYFSWHVSAAA